MKTIIIIATLLCVACSSEPKMDLNDKIVLASEKCKAAGMCVEVSGPTWYKSTAQAYCVPCDAPQPNGGQN